MSRLCRTSVFLPDSVMATARMTSCRSFLTHANRKSTTNTDVTQCSEKRTALGCSSNGLRLLLKCINVLRCVLCTNINKKTLVFSGLACSVRDVLPVAQNPVEPIFYGVCRPSWQCLSYFMPLSSDVFVHGNDDIVLFFGELLSLQTWVQMVAPPLAQLFSNATLHRQ